MKYQLIFLSNKEIDKSWIIQLKLNNDKINYKSSTIIDSDSSIDEIKSSFLQNEEILEIVNIIPLEI